MKVVDIEHTREGSELFADLINLHMQRRVLQQDANAAPHEGNGTHEDEGHDDERDEGVGSEASVTQHRLRVPGGDNTTATVRNVSHTHGLLLSPWYVLDDEAGNYNTHRAKRVSKDMQQHSMHVHVTLGFLVLLLALVAGGGGGGGGTVTAGTVAMSML